MIHDPKDFKTEEDVKIKFLLPYLEERGYKASHCDFEKAIEVHEGRKVKSIYADIVVYTSGQKTAPLIVCDAKAPNEILDRSAKEQAISYARLLDHIAPLALITNGAQVQVFQTLNKNRIPELPHREELDRDLLHFFVSTEIQEALRAEAKHDLFIIDDVQTFKNILKACHNEIRNNEGYDPTEAFDEMSKVLFCKLYEEKHGDSNRFRLSVFEDTLNRLKVNVISQIFNETKADSRYSGLFAPDVTIQLQDRTIRKVVSIFENYDLSLTAFDVKGEAYEYFLSDTFTGGLGEYFTPRNVVEFMVDAIDPKIGEKIIDPFCGTGGFLIYAFEVVGEKIRLQDFSDEEKERWRYDLSNKSLFGTDWKERTSQACRMNMNVHGDGSAGIIKYDGLQDVPERGIVKGTFHACLTNPPFGADENNPDILKNYTLGAGRKSQDRVILAIERAIRLVKPGGRVGIIVIDGVLNNTSTKYVRDYIKQQTWIRGIVSLTKKTFEGYGAGAKTSVLILDKKAEPDNGDQEPVFMAVAANTGYAPNGAPIPGNELPDILLDYKAFRRGETLGHATHTWVAPVADRLDAEFYWRRAITEDTRVEDVQQDVSDLLRQLQEEYAEIEEKIATVFAEQETHPVKLEDFLEEVKYSETVEPERDYRILGVSGQGKGAFIRETKKGREVKGRTLYRVSAGWIIYNRLFAFHGSFAVLSEEHEGYYVSNEFPTFIVKDGVESPDIVAKYIVHCLNSPYYLSIVDAQSTGSTKESRNRFNQKLFLAMEVEMPVSRDAVEEIVNLLDRLDALRAGQQTLLERVKVLRQGVAGLLPRPKNTH